MRTLGARRIALIASLLSAAVFAMTAYQQFFEYPMDMRVFATVAFALLGALVIWAVYGVFVLLRWLFRRFHG